MNEKLRTSLSKTLSYILRHDTNIKRDSGGWVNLADISDSRLLEHLNEIVETSDKNRFEYDAVNRRIRARQGHSVREIQEEQLLTPRAVDSEGKIDGFTYAVHSTFLSCIPTIRASGGLSKMKRNHIHMVLADLDDIKTLNKKETISGMRKNADAFIAIHLEQAAKQGCKFYMSSNNVLLSAGNSNGSIPWSCCTVYH
jgi:2'-phosphotransferase